MACSALEAELVTKIDEVQTEENEKAYTLALVELNDLTSHVIQHEVLGETERAERAREELIAKRNEIDITFGK